jgi:hypothetical protein
MTRLLNSNNTKENANKRYSRRSVNDRAQARKFQRVAQPVFEKPEREAKITNDEQADHTCEQAGLLAHRKETSPHLAQVDTHEEQQRGRCHVGLRGGVRHGVE